MTIREASDDIGNSLRYNSNFVCVGIDEVNYEIYLYTLKEDKIGEMPINDSMVSEMEAKYKFPIRVKRSGAAFPA